MRVESPQVESQIAASVLDAMKLARAGAHQDIAMMRSSA
jgi:hypothetical protein